MVSENSYDVMMFMMLCTSIHTKQTSCYVQIIIYIQSRQILRFRLAWSLQVSTLLKFSQFNLSQIVIGFQGISISLIFLHWELSQHNQSFLAAKISQKYDLNECSIEYQPISNFQPKSTISLLSNGQVVHIKVLWSVSAS